MRVLFSALQRRLLLVIILGVSNPLLAEKPAKKAADLKKEKVEEAAKKEEEAKPEKTADQKKAEPAEKAEAKTHEVKEEEFVLKAKLSGVIESTRATPVALDLKQWADLLVIKAVEHGTAVKKGDILIELDTEKVKEKIENLEQGMTVKKLANEAAHLDLEKLEKTTPITLEKSRQAKVQAEADLAYYEDVTRGMKERDAKETVTSAENYLAYAQEELDQLTKMYEQDDLTEETEEIILKRAQHSVKSYEWMLKKAKERTERTLTTTIPREHEQMKRDLELHRISWRAAEKSTRDALTKKREEVAAADRQYEESVKSLDELKADLKLMTVRAPQDGIVYYGMAQRGKWTTASTVERKLLPGAKLTMREIVMTVADPSRVQLRAAVSETQIKDLEIGQSAETTMKWNSDVKLNGKLTALSFVPSASNTFDAKVSLSAAPKERPVMPGMAATAEVTTYENKKALTIPKSAIKKDGEKETVTLKGGKVRVIETGKSDGKKVEVTRGLKDGDIIELSPAEKEAADDKPAEKPDAKPAAKPDAKAKS